MVNGVQLDTDTETLRGSGADGIDDINHDFCTFLGSASVCIGTMVCLRSQELGKQVAVSSMNLHAMKPGLCS